MGTQKYGEENWFGNPMGIPAYDYLENVYDGNNNLVTATYKLGGNTANVVCELQMTYDANNNLLTLTRTI